MIKEKTEFKTIVKRLILHLGIDLICHRFLIVEKYKKRTLSLENQLKCLQEDYSSLTSQIEYAKRTRHDLRHHLNVINAMNNMKNYTEIAKYLESCESICRNMEEMALCESPLFDSVLKYYLRLAKDNNITVKTDVVPFSKNLNFDITDLTSLMGNLMENAIESCHGLLSPSIYIWIRLTEVSLLIKMVNSCDTGLKEYPSFSNGTVFTSTKKSLLHGQGLKSIRHTAEKYHGSAEFKRINGKFTARIVMNIPP